MPEWKHDILIENIRALLKRYDMTQQQLAGITGMTQANVSKALNSNDKCTSLWSRSSAFHSTSAFPSMN